MATIRTPVLSLPAPNDQQRREAQRALYDLVYGCFVVSADESRLERVLYRCGPIELRRGSYYVSHLGTKFRPIEAAHVLRVGPEGPLIDPLRYGSPRDGDHANIHPNNWKPRGRGERGSAGRAAALRARKAAIASRLLPADARPGVPWFRGFDRALTDPRAWWVRAVSAWGDTDPALSTAWPAAREHAPHHWALCHHLALRARELLGHVTSSTGAHTDARGAAVAAAQAELIAERDRIANGPPAVRGALLARMRAAYERGEIHDDPDRAAGVHRAAHADAVPATEAHADAVPAADDLY